MKIFRPVKSNYKSQEFGQNEACAIVHLNGRPYFPYRIVGKIAGVCPIATKPFYQLIGMKGHNGVDWPTWFKEPVYFDTDYEGWMKTEVDFSGGVGVDVVSKDPILQCTEPGCDKKHYIKRRFWHLHSPVGYDKKPVIRGQLIGYSDSTGASTGHHVHAGTKWCDKNGNGLHKNNGYYGAFNDKRYRDDSVFVVDYVREKLQMQLDEQRRTQVQKIKALLFDLKQLLSELQQKVNKLKSKLHE